MESHTLCWNDRVPVVDLFVPRLHAYGSNPCQPCDDRSGRIDCRIWRQSRLGLYVGPWHLWSIVLVHSIPRCGTGVHDYSGRYLIYARWRFRSRRFPGGMRQRFTTVFRKYWHCQMQPVYSTVMTTRLMVEISRGKLRSRIKGFITFTLVETRQKMNLSNFEPNKMLNWVCQS